MPTNKKSTSKQVAKEDSKAIKKSPKKMIQSIAGSGLSQVDPKKETGKKVASKAGKVLGNQNSTKKEREISASVLAQTPEKKPVKKSKK